MKRIAICLITTGLYISVCAALVSEHGNQKSVGTDKQGYSADEEGDSGGVDDEPERDRRVLQSGDILTPPELLPLAKRLISKVDTRQPGEGTGIVSSAKSPEVLADTLFHNFFSRDRRIRQLTKYDISGLDALQALALDGEGVYKNLKLISVDGGRCYVDKLNNHGVVDNNMCYPNGPGPRKSIYKLLTKPVTLDSKNSIPNQRKKRQVNKIPQNRIVMQNKLQKKRKLIVTGRKHQNGEEKNKSNNIKNNKDNVNFVTSRPLTESPINGKETLKGCRWKFECTLPRDLDTCRLKTFCSNKEEKGTEQEQAMQNVRRMIGISSVDEEVEKILEARMLRLRPISNSNHRAKVDEL